jgi:hypothetical protein
MTAAALQLVIDLLDSSPNVEHSLPVEAPTALLAEEWR